MQPREHLIQLQPFDGAMAPEKLSAFLYEVTPSPGPASGMAWTCESFAVIGKTDRPARIPNTDYYEEDR